MNCKDCKHWDNKAWEAYGFKDIGACKHPEPLWEIDHGYISTKPDFGCVQFEAK